MKQESQQSDEPVGIVISGGKSRSTNSPRFIAYVWAPAPEDDTELELDVRAA